MNNLDELSQLLRRAVAGEDVDITSAIENVSFDFKLQGQGFEQSLTTDVMKGLVSMQKYINQIYSLVKYDDIKVLTKEERQALQLNVKLEKGSSLVEVSANGLVQELAKMMSTLGATNITVILLGFALMWAGQNIATKWLNNRKEIALKQEETKAKAQETERMAIVTQAIAQNYRLENIQRQVDDAQTELLKSLVNVEQVTFSNGESLTGAELGNLTRQTRRQSEYIRLDGEYIIEQHTPKQDKLKLARKKDGLTFDAVIDESILNDSAQLQRLQAAEWHKQSVNLEINGKKIDKQIKDAVIINVI